MNTGDALALLEAGDTEGATEHALVAMALFEDALVILGPAEGDVILVLDQLPPGIQNQLDANSIFSLEESITGSESDGENLSSLISTNGFDIDLGDYNDALDNAKESLANGDFIGAEEQLDLANELLDDVYEELYEAIDSEQPERIDAFIENTIETLEFIISNAQALGLTDDDVASIQAVLVILQSGDVDKILEATSEDSELNQGQDYDPQISANEVDQGPEGPDDSAGSDGADGENHGGDVPPGFEKKVAEDNLPPGFEKKVDGLKIDEDGKLVATGEGDLSPGFLKMLENEKQLPKGVLKNLAGIDEFESFFDDYFDDSVVDDDFNDNVGVDADIDADYELEVKDSPKKDKKDKGKDQGQGKGTDKGSSSGEGGDKGGGKGGDKGGGKGGDKGGGKGGDKGGGKGGG